MYDLQPYYHLTDQQVGRLLTATQPYIPAAPGKSSFMVDAVIDRHYLPNVFFDRPHRVQLVGLLPSQQIVAHTDAPIRGWRYHLPLQTNDGCWSFSTGVWSQLEVGRLYLMDPTEPHGAVNWGETLRLHLMIDVEEG